MRNFIGAALAWAAIVSSGPVLADDATHQLNLQPSDIEAVVFEQDSAWLKLTPSAGDALRNVTAHNQGSWLKISVDGIEAMTIRIFSAVDSGVVEVSRPSDELSSMLKQIQ